MQNIAERYPKSVACAALLLLSFIAYANSLPNSFQYDDIEGIVRNPAIRNLRNVAAYFTDPQLFRLARSVDWRPILQITYAINYAIGGFDPAVFRIFNLLFHAGTAFFLFLIVAEIHRKSPTPLPPGPAGLKTWFPLIPAALFAVHPVTSQGVNYIWARSSVLAALFFLIAFYCFLRGPLGGDNRRHPWWHGAALLAFALGVASKATVVSLPAALVLYEMLFLNPDRQNVLRLYWSEPRRLIKYLPFAIAFAAYVLLRKVVLFGGLMSFLRVAPVTPLDYLFTQFRAWVYYMKLYLWPHPLMVEFPGFGWSRSLWDLHVLGSLFLVLAILSVVWRIRRICPLAAFFACWFFIALLPEASVIIRPDPITGHRPYPAYTGLSVVAALVSIYAAHWIWRQWSKPESNDANRFWRAYGVALAAILVILTGVTILRNRDWRDPVTLWSSVLKTDPTHAGAYISLGTGYINREDYAEAEKALTKAVELWPRNGTARMHRGYLYTLLERDDRALEDFTTGIELSPYGRLNYFYRGELYRKLGRYEEALGDYRSALKLGPGSPGAYFGIAMVHWERKELAEATAACRKVVESDPEDLRGYRCLGSLFMHRSLFEEARKIYAEGIKRFAEDYALWYGLATAYEELDRYAEAEEAYTKASQLLQKGP